MTFPTIDEDSSEARNTVTAAISWAHIQASQVEALGTAMCYFSNVGRPRWEPWDLSAIP